MTVWKGQILVCEDFLFVCYTDTQVDACGAAEKGIELVRDGKDCVWPT